ncbi:MAG: sugar ABC transporter permease [Cereibacter sphaeroides]|uniref:Sugar ABC transporter permease n=1 Tax=Cereibacter sphaeroides TaxID=1063 RepID=A0A2W5RYW1_CERSP|nr:MAG: sugar ABC transporter permease [Cereibacter sphaeroides]
MQKKDIGLAVLILVVGCVVSLINPLFLSPVNLANTANLIGLFGIFSIASAFVIATGGIDLSVGSVIAFLGVIFVDLIAVKLVPWPIVAVIIILLGVIIGSIHGWLITRVGIQPFVVTLCGLLIYRGLARYYTHDGTAGFTFGQAIPSLEAVIAGRLLGVPNSLIAFAIVTVVSWYVLHRSIFGRHLMAVGKNEQAARYTGINTKRVIVLAYVICSSLTAVAAMFLAMYTRSVQPSSHGNFYELYGIAAAVLGGFSLRGGEGSIIGVVLGVGLLQVLQNLVNLLGIPSSLNFAVMGAVILVGVIADNRVAAMRERRRNAATAALVMQGGEQQAAKG